MAELRKTFKKNRNFIILVIGMIILMNCAFWLFLSVFLARLWAVEPTGESLTLSTVDPVYEENFLGNALPEPELGQEQDEHQEEYQEANPEKPIVGDDRELIFMIVAIDYRGDNYLYGLADSIRLVRIDFAVPQINVVSLPRSLLVEVPTDRIHAENPVLLNQSYFYGTPGMGHYVGNGYGAGSLAETIQYNFGITVDHYAVIDFKGFIQLIDALDGIEVDLPEAIDDFPAGKQVLDGEHALMLARTRKDSTDLKRMDNQTYILQALFRKLKSPAVFIRLPELVNSLKDTIFTDVTPEQIWTLIYLLQRMNEENILYASPPDDVMTHDTHYIPSVNREMQIIRWDDAFTSWLGRSLWKSIE